MSLELDDRRRAMLMEMNIKVWTDPRTPAAAVIAVPDRAGVPAADPSQARGPVPQTPAVAAPLASLGASPGASPGTGARAPVARQPLPPGIDTMDWVALEAAVAGCRACNLCATRKNTVFGAGSRQADWLVVGEAPGENEDLAGEPFVGQAGTLLDNMLKAIGLARGSDAGGGTYISNVIKCRPPANRNPLPEEVAQCEPYLRRQVELLQPKIILALGRFAVQSLLQSAEPIGKMRGRVHEYHGVPVIVSYHPAYLLRSLPEKAKAWADLCLAAEVMKQRR
ncbi:MAG: uracil-DNA glycosylase [Comamonadaceae bacterium]|nr:MAG: uracil-DNA glycosylase [Comamonadaceae bacterium]